MEFRTISYLLIALAAAACGNAADSTANMEDNLNGGSTAESKPDGGRDCRPSAPGERSPCAKGDPGNGPGDHGRSDAAKGHDGDDDDQGDKKDGGKKK
jgi:hypothetical protein